MNMTVVLLVFGTVIVATIIVGLVIHDIYLMHKIHEFEAKNAELRNENIGLMKHNGKLYDENFKLRTGIDVENIPSYDEW